MGELIPTRLGSGYSLFSIFSRNTLSLRMRLRNISNEHITQRRNNRFNEIFLFCRFTAVWGQTRPTSVLVTHPFPKVLPASLIATFFRLPQLLPTTHPPIMHPTSLNFSLPPSPQIMHPPLFTSHPFLLLGLEGLVVCESTMARKGGESPA